MNSSSYLMTMTVFGLIFVICIFLLYFNRNIKRIQLDIIMIVSVIMFMLSGFKYTQARNKEDLHYWHVEEYRYGWFQGFNDVELPGSHNYGDTVKIGDSIRYVIILKR